MKCAISQNSDGFKALHNEVALSTDTLNFKVVEYQEKNDTTKMPTKEELGLSTDKAIGMINDAYGDVRPTPKEGVKGANIDQASRIIPGMSEIGSMSASKIKSNLISEGIINSTGKVIIDPNTASMKITMLNDTLSQAMDIPQDVFAINRNGEAAEITINNSALNSLKEDHDRSKITEAYSNVTDVESGLIALKKDSNLNARQKELVSKLQTMSTHNNIPIEFVQEGVETGEYDTKNNVIHLNENTFDAGTVIHEIAHALGVKALAANSDNAIHFAKMFDDLKQRTGANKIESLEGINDYQEFFANLFNNTELIAELETASAEGLHASGSIRSAFRAIMNFIRQAIGLSPMHTNAMTEVVKMGMRSIQYDMKHAKAARDIVAKKYFEQGGFSEMMFDATRRTQSSAVVSRDAMSEDIGDYAKSKIKNLDVHINKQGVAIFTAPKGGEIALKNIYKFTRKTTTNKVKLLNDADGNVIMKIYPMSTAVAEATAADNISIAELMQNVNELDGVNNAEGDISLTGEVVVLEEEFIDNIGKIVSLLGRYGNSKVKIVTEKEMSESFNNNTDDNNSSSVYADEFKNRTYSIEANGDINIVGNKASSKTLVRAALESMVKSNKFLAAFDTANNNETFGLIESNELLKGLKSSEIIDKLFNDVDFRKEADNTPFESEDREDGWSLLDELVSMVEAVAETDGETNFSTSFGENLVSLSNPEGYYASEADKYTNEENIDMSEYTDDNLDFNTSKYAASVKSALSDIGVNITEEEFGDMSDLEVIYAINTIARSNDMNPTTLKLLANIINGMPIGKRIPNVEAELMARFGFSESNTDGSKVLNTALNKALEKFTTEKGNTVSENFLVNSKLAEIDQDSLMTAVANNIKAEGLDSSHSKRKMKGDLAIIENMLADKTEFSRKVRGKSKSAEQKFQDNKNKLRSFREMLEAGQSGRAIATFIKDVKAEVHSKALLLNNIEKSHSMGNTSREDITKDTDDLNEMDSFIELNEQLISVTRKFLVEAGNRFSDPDTVSRDLHEMTDKINYMSTKISRIQKYAVAASLDPIAEMSGYKDAHGTIMNKFDEMDDISWYRKQVNSMAESTNPLLSLTDYATKQFLEDARQDLMFFKRDMQLLHKELLDSGVKDSSFSYELDENGVPTGYLVSTTHMGRYKAELDKRIKEILNNKSTTDDVKDDAIKKLRKSKDLRDQFPNKKFNSIVNTAAKKAYLDKTNEKLKELNILVGRTSDDLMAPMVSRSSHEMFKAATKGGRDGVKAYVKGQFANRVDDIDVNPSDISEIDGFNFEQKVKPKTLKINGKKVIGDTSVTKNIMTTRSGKPIDSIPLHYVNKLEDMKDASTDLTQNMVMFAGSVYNNHHLNKIVGTVELANKLIDKSIKIIKRDSAQNRIVARFSSNNKDYTKNLYETGESNVKSRMQGYLDMVFYGRVKNIGKDFKMNIMGEEVVINSEKMLDKLGMYTAYNSLALNLYAGIQNVFNAEAQMLMEANAGQYMDHAGIKWAKKLLAKEMGSAARESIAHKRIKENKLNMFYEAVNTFNSSRAERANTSTTYNGVKNNGIADLAFLTSSSGEYWAQGQSSLALADKVKLINKDGKKVNLYEALEVDEKKGVLVLPEGTKDADGKVLSETERKNVMKSFTIRQNQLNVKMYGNYNEVDKTLMERSAGGRLAMMFRKFMVPGFNRRWGKEYFDHALGRDVQGFHMNHAKMIKKHWTAHKLDILSAWKDMSDNERADVSRSLTEISLYMGVTAVLMALGDACTGEEADCNWAQLMAMYQVKRFQVETGFFMNPGESVTVIQSPAAAINQVESLTNLVTVILNPFAWGDTYSTGDNAGRYKLLKAGTDAIGGKTIEGWFKPKAKLQYLNKF